MTYIDYKKRHYIRREARYKRMIERATNRKERIESLTFNFQLLVVFWFLFMIGWWWCTGSTSLW